MVLCLCSVVVVVMVVFVELLLMFRCLVLILRLLVWWCRFVRVVMVLLIGVGKGCLGVSWYFSVMICIFEWSVWLV